MKHKPIYFMLLVVVTTFLCGCNSPEAPKVRPTFSLPVELQPGTEIHSEKHRDLADAMDKYLSDLVDDDQFMGSVLVAFDGEIVLKRGYGLANVQNEIPDSPETIFGIASLTKQFTAMAILQLQESRKLDVQDPISRYLPDYPNGGEITIHQLLCHTSGLPKYFWFFDDTEEEMGQPHTPDELVAKFINKPHFSPGTSFAYSNPGYVLLGMIIEKVSGQTYGEYVEENIFSVLNMSNSGYDNSEQGLPDRAIGFTSLRTHREAIHTHASYSYSAGGLHSTVEDLYIWDQALRGETVLNRTGLDMTFSVHSESTLVGSHYGYGWFIDVGTDGPTKAWHGGSMTGFASLIIRHLEDETVIIILSNFEGANIGNIARDFEEMLSPLCT
jgi:CubicO group peptidase (beta-lactamase class C family)